MVESVAFSVVLPTYRPDPAFLKAAVDSVLGQTWTDFELLVVEDPSEVSAAAILEGYDDPRLRLETGRKRTSLVAQLNRGIELARAPWIARMDGDDIALPTRLEKQHQRLEAQPEIDVLGTQIEVIDGEGRPIGARRFPTDHAAILDALRTHNPLSHPSVVFRRSRVEQWGGYRMADRPAEDYELWSRWAVAGARFANHPESLVQYRLHEASIKVQQVRRALLGTTEIQKTYWFDDMSWRERLFYRAQRAALLLPPGLTYALARRFRYRQDS